MCVISLLLTKCNIVYSDDTIIIAYVIFANIKKLRSFHLIGQLEKNALLSDFFFFGQIINQPPNELIGYSSITQGKTCTKLSIVNAY